MIKLEASENQRKHREKSEITGVPRAGLEPAHTARLRWILSSLIFPVLQLFYMTVGFSNELSKVSRAYSKII